MHGGDDSLSLDLPDEAATLALGGRLAQALVPGLSIWLVGDLGSGKTTLARGLLRGLGYDGRVKSPTYTLVELYTLSRFNLYHFDLYRIADPDEWEDAGFREFFDQSGVCLVEWPERVAGRLPVPDVRIRLEFRGAGRAARLDGLTEEGKICIARLSPC
ncbi:MAG TPA: tRNA (adenosine(37)-N6)-threonylcarbamoyltransferase complex ATPase subunit type 1 TsaE [Thiobacillaceae bacterium]|nr:tRNA (adenosine(37)-N6)-threonylcarbamoyltransferase complex ATPase subunit type 1 TsaE [Thiobacillaceae bacterium]HNU64145.1 tRNA (adenosine(37)-N6)-threonylcarbamoyltransferase complex ATPase subunit type 1 TsaE [Thiobacillaceae bacterium]